MLNSDFVGFGLGTEADMIYDILELEFPEEVSSSEKWHHALDQAGLDLYDMMLVQITDEVENFVSNQASNIDLPF